jgi:RimJ/RimL family protein N-acetyltransferase
MVRAEKLGPGEARGVSHIDVGAGVCRPDGNATMTILDQSAATIRIPGLALRPLREGDDARLFALFANWNVMRFLSSPPWPYAAEDARNFVRARMNEGADTITAVITLDDTLIGVTDAIVKPASVAQRERGYSLGYWIGEPYWGRGYMSEAARAFIAHVFARIPDNTLYSGAFTANAASLRIQDKLGFVRDGESMFFSNPHGKETPHTNTSLTRARFAAATG